MITLLAATYSCSETGNEQPELAGGEKGCVLLRLLRQWHLTDQKLQRFRGSALQNAGPDPSCPSFYCTH